MRACSRIGCPNPPVKEDVRTDVERQWCASHVPGHSVDHVRRIVPGPPVTPAADRALDRRPPTPGRPGEPAPRRPEDPDGKPRQTPNVRPRD